ncbi:MAG TPA: glycoside hydrolase [Acidobacteriaceae bacterium]|nr:glycoside hydrolase [Acidobacteriaceae bacterium]
MPAQEPSHAHVDFAGLIGRSDIVLAHPNSEATQAMPLGNGLLGVAVWSADGLTAQLNRVDTLPDRLPLARLTMPGLARLTAARDYVGRLDLYNGELHESGGGMTAALYVDSSTDTLIVDVSGANPAEAQKVLLSLAPPRAPKAEAAGAIATLSESWLDDKQPGASGRGFGTLAAITAEGREVSSAVADSTTVALTFKPYADGHFRVLVAGPHFNGRSGLPGTVASQSLQKALRREAVMHAEHRKSWHDFWQHAGYMKITSPDGSGEYMENLRALYLYSAAAQSSGEYPGSQAGVEDMFSSVLEHHWDPGAFWHWNLRMQVAANLSSGVPELNAPYFKLYRENLTSIEDWTRKHMNGLPGICVPETMRFNGPGIEYETWDNDPPVIGLNCDASFKPYYNARTISTGAEISLWIWQQYLATNDRAFLAKNFPVMAAAARFLLAYEKPGSDGLRHTSPSNAHETQWDLEDPMTDLSARMGLYKAAIEAAQVLHTEPALVEQLQGALPKIPPLPRTEMDTAKTLLTASADAAGNDVLAASYSPAAENHNVENLGLEPVWPYDLIGDTSPLFELARRTYLHRPYPVNQDWSDDPIQAARLQLPDEVKSTLIQLTQHYQTFVNGYANWGGKNGEFYVEQQGVVAAALNEALVQDYDGTIRIDPAFPKEWDVDGQVLVRGKTRVDVRVKDGTVQRVTVEAGSTGRVKVRNPWAAEAQGKAQDVLLTQGMPMVKLSGPILEFSAVAGRRYLLMPASAEAEHAGASTAAEIGGTPAATAKRLGSVQIGIFP